MVQKVELSNAFIYACTFNYCLLGFIFVFFYLIHRRVRYIMLLAPFCAHAAGTRAIKLDIFTFA